MRDKRTFTHEETTTDFLGREAARNLFGQPDVAVVHEYLHIHRTNEAYTPETRLIAAVLEDGITCYLKYCSAKTRRGKRIFSEAAQWIFNRNEDWIFGFDNACEMLKLDPDYIRKVLKQTTRERLNRSSGHQLSEDSAEIALPLAS